MSCPRVIQRSVTMQDLQAFNCFVPVLGLGLELGLGLGLEFGLHLIHFRVKTRVRANVWVRYRALSSARVMVLKRVRARLM